MLAWIDLETTGLDPNKHTVLEVAAIITDDRLREVARFERVVYWMHAEDFLPEYSEDPRNAMAKHGVSQVVVDMHRANGLWEASRDSTTFLGTADEELAEFLEQCGVTTVAVKNSEGIDSVEMTKPQLAGSTISFDRSFLAVHCPLACRQLHYRNVDVTTFNEIARRFWPAVHDARPKAEKGAHRAMADILESLAVGRYYVEQLGPVCMPGTNINALESQEDTIVGAIATWIDGDSSIAPAIRAQLVEGILLKRWKS